MTLEEIQNELTYWQERIMEKHSPTPYSVRVVLYAHSLCSMELQVAHNKTVLFSVDVQHWTWEEGLAALSEYLWQNNFLVSPTKVKRIENGIR